MACSKLEAMAIYVVKQACGNDIMACVYINRDAKNIAQPKLNMAFHFSPFFQSAHMAVIEALMQLFIKEQVSVERVLNTVNRFSAPVSTSEAPTDPDSALLLWTKRCCESLKLRIEDELKSNGDEVRYFLKKSCI